MEIVLARHGKPDLRYRTWIAPRHWTEAYDRADVIVQDIPLDIRRKARTSRVLVSSTSRRCVQSARALSEGRSFLTEAVFGEPALPYWNWRAPRLPLPVWGLLLQTAWLCGFSANTESVSQATARASRAAARLVQLACDNDSVFLMGHGIMTLLIARQLVRLGWAGPKRPLHGHWHFSVYRR